MSASSSRESSLPACDTPRNLGANARSRSNDIFRFLGGGHAATAPVGGASKRCFDLLFAVAALVTLLPLLLLVALAVKMHDGGPIFFRHARIGTRGQSFPCLKFRTMRIDSDTALAEHLASDAAARREWLETRKLKSDPRVTSVGYVLRKSSLDELPQIINILLGHMSIVGPRPVVGDELAMYGQHVQSYFAARPGLTGPWQISGRNDTTYSERVRFDCAYVERWSLAKDVMIILRTIPAVFLSRGSY